MRTIYAVSVLIGMGLATAAAATDDFRQWMQQQQADFQEYKDKRDKEFTAFLKQNWKEVDLLKGKKRDEKPKPKSIPVAKPAPAPKAPPEPVSAPETRPFTVKPPAVTTIPVPGSPPPVKMPQPVKPPPVAKPDKPAPSPSAKVRPAAPAPVVVAPPPVTTPAPVTVVTTPKKRYKGKKLILDYYGDDVLIYYDPALRVTIGTRIDKQKISDIWSKLGMADYEPVIEQLKAIRSERGLNDWAFAVLVDNFSKKVAPSKNGREFLNWFLLIKADYEARVAYDANSIKLLLPTKQPLYAVPYFTFDGIRFYAVSFDGRDVKLGRVFTYDGRYPGATESLDMRLTSDMIPPRKGKVRQLKFRFKGRDYSIEAKYDNRRVEFLDSYPQLDLGMYFTAKVADDSATSLHGQLAKHIEGMSQLDAVNFLLVFVQTAFEYKTDDVQFGKENYLFPEETLHYRYSDCEDRSVLFAWLVKNLVGLDVVGLDFPGHVATAVHFTDPVQGDAVTWQGKRYIVTDPTYINAVAGMTMPEYKSAKPKVIAIQ